MDTDLETAPEEGEIEAKLSPMTPEEDEQWRALELAIEAKLTRLYGPPEVRDRRNKRYVRDLVKKHTEPVIRGIIHALSKGGSDGTSQMLRNPSATTPLHQIINRHYGCGPCIEVKAVEGNNYTVSIRGGIPEMCCGAGGEYTVTRKGKTYKVTGEPRRWIS